MKKILEGDPENLQAHLELGRIYREKGEYELAVKEFEKIMDSVKEDTFLKNRVLNEIEISQRKVVLESKPQGLNIMLSSKCNISCITSL